MLIMSRKLNTSPATLEDKEALKKFLTTPPVKKIDLHFPLGLEVTARNLKGVTIKDALDAIHKQFKKKVRQSDPVTYNLPMLMHHCPGGRRIRTASPCWLRVGQGRVVDEAESPPEEGRCAVRRLKEEEEQGQGWR